MKIAVIGAKGLPGYGGAARSNDNILRRLADKYEITVYALDTHAKSENYHGIRQHIFKSYRNKNASVLFYYIRSLFHVIFLKKYDLIHLNHRVSGFLVPFLKLRGYKIISSIHGLGYKNDGKWGKITRRFFYICQVISFKFSDTITTVQKSSVNYIQQYSKREVIYIPNGVDSNMDKFISFNRKDIITFSAARIIYLKGCHDFLKALKKLKFEGKVRIIGDLNQVDEYKQEILCLSTDLNVEFLGLINNSESLFKKLSESKLFVFPSYTEGMSNMLLEVASLKVPIIASDIQPNKDVFNENEITFFGTGDHNDLAKKIEQFFAEDEVYRRKTENAYRKLKSEYNWDMISNQFDNLYQKMA